MTTELLSYGMRMELVEEEERKEDGEEENR